MTMIVTFVDDIESLNSRLRFLSVDPATIVYSIQCWYKKHKHGVFLKDQN